MTTAGGSKPPTLAKARPYVLAYVREHPGALTRDIAFANGLTQHNAWRVLNFLQRQKLVGRQSSLVFGQYESTWTAELEAKPKKRPTVAQTGSD